MKKYLISGFNTVQDVNKPLPIYPLGDGTYHFNYNIEEVIDEEGHKSFNCDTIHVGDISYDNLVSKMIAEKYPIDKELALHRQREIKTEEFQVYFDYCEECKRIAREL